MNKLKLVLGVLVIVTFGCQDLVNEDLEDKDPVIVTTINPSEDTQAKLILREALTSGYHKSTISIDSLIAEIDHSEAVLVQQKEGGISRYTFTLNAKESLSYENLIVQVNEFGEYGAMIFRYEPDIDWLMNNNGVVNQNDFTGKIRLLTIDRKEFNQVVMSAGQGEYTPVENVQNKLFKTDCNSGSGDNSGGNSGSTGEGGPETGGNTGGSGDDGSSGGSSGDGSGSESGNSESEESSGGENTSGGSSCFWYMEGVTLVIDCTPFEIDWPVLDEDPDDIIVTKSATTCDGQVEAPTIGDGDVIGTLGGDDVNLMEIIITDLSLHPCTEDLFNLIETVQHEGMRGVIDQFAGENSQFIYEIKIDNIVNGHKAETNVDEFNSRKFTTSVDLDFLKNATKVSIVRTLMHEAIHAYIHSYIIGLTNGSVTRAESLTTFPELWTELLEAKYGDTAANIERYQHEEMARNYVETISNALKELFGSSLNDQFYEDIAWGGLLETDTFKKSNSLSETDKTRIKNLNYNEDVGNSNAKSDKCGS